MRDLHFISRSRKERPTNLRALEVRIFFIVLKVRNGINWLEMVFLVLFPTYRVGDEIEGGLEAV